jgi:hypothetical protein
MSQRIVHLYDDLQSAQITAPGENHVAIQPFVVLRETRMALFQHPDSTVLFPAIELEGRCELRCGIGIKDVVWDRVQTPIHFTINLVDPLSGQRKRLFSRKLDVRRTADRRFHDLTIVMPGNGRRSVRLEFITAVLPGQDSSYCWCGWTDPIIQIDAPAVQRTQPLSPTAAPSASSRQRHVILITADALRSDGLGCCGAQQAQTPHLDQLAAEGFVVAGARSQTTTSLGGFVSLMSGRYSTEHGIDNEWGDVPAVTNLPQYLAAQGYRTVAVCGEREHEARPGSLFGWFDAMVPCFGTPCQSGDITQRNFSRWLDAHGDKPFCAWLQFFDVHPPATLNREYARLYYDGDPTSSRHAYREADVQSIRGCEVLLELQHYFAAPDLNRGYLAKRLEATAQVLLGQSQARPDLAALLQAWGSAACLGMAEREFGQWLLRQAQRLRSREDLGELQAWLATLLPKLQHVDAEVIAWLRDVKDFRYPCAQYASAITFLDAQIGKLVADLKARGLYEQTTIVVTSPHGELLGEHGLCFHHWTATEEVLQIPLILKPAGDGQPRGVRVTGMMNQIDIFPTLIESLGLPLPSGVSGRSCWPELQTGQLAPVDCISFGYNRSMVVMAREHHVLIHALDDLYAGPHWSWRAGDTRLFALSTPMDYSTPVNATQPALLSELSGRLDAWLQRHGMAPTLATAR